MKRSLKFIAGIMACFMVIAVMGTDVYAANPTVGTTSLIFTLKSAFKISGLSLPNSKSLPNKEISSIGEYFSITSK